MTAWLILPGAVLALIVAEFLAGRLGATWIRPRPDPDLHVVAHRGASRHAPENTLAAFALAVEHGADSVECDVVFSGDGVPIVSHHLDLTPRVQAELRPAVVSRMTVAQLKRLDIGRWFATRFEGERVQTLAEALAFLGPRFRRIYLHDKHDDDLPQPSPERVAVFARVIRESGLVEKIHVMVRSGNLAPWRAAAPEIALIQSRNGPDGRRGRIPLAVSYAAGMRHLVVYASARGLLQRGRILCKLGLPNLGFLVGFWPAPGIVREYREKGATFVVFTVNDALRARLYLRAGFSAIGTDDPRLLVGLVRDLKG